MSMEYCNRSIPDVIYFGRTKRSFNVLNIARNESGPESSSEPFLDNSRTGGGGAFNRLEMVPQDSRICKHRDRTRELLAAVSQRCHIVEETDTEYDRYVRAGAGII